MTYIISLIVYLVLILFLIFAPILFLVWAEGYHKRANHRYALETDEVLPAIIGFVLF